MKPRKSHKPRPKLSFAVDRAEIDISSDWVDAITQAREFPAPAAPVFFVDQQQSATVAKASTVARHAPVAQVATVEEQLCDATVEPLPTVASTTTVEEHATVEGSATVAQSPRFARVLRPRPLRRITDGMTPGQFAVYSLMYEEGEVQPQEKSRLYRGGYLDLCRLTGLSKRGVQNIVAELQLKNVITIRQAPGHHKTQTTIYQVDSEDVVLAGWHSRGYRFAIGKGKALIHSATVAVSATQLAAF
jgi:hypothetical protein